jgi:DUF4097 and DUF4098 domain-containing protein YvlB
VASPVVTPPRRRRSLTGPFILIILGVVFLLANLGVVSHQRLGLLFAHYWPVLLILWGLIKLFEYSQAKRDNQPVPGIGAGGIVLMIFLVIFGLMATHAANFHWDDLRDQIDLGNSDIDIPGFGKTFNYDDQLAQALPAGTAVKIVNDRGAVNVSVSNDDQLRVTVRKKIRADEQKDADYWNAGTKPQINVSGNLVTINANTMGAGDHPVIADLDVSIPRKAALTVASKRGDVSVMGRDASVDISNQKGDVSVEDVTGNVNLNLDRSSARVTNIAGDVSVDGHSNEVSLNDIKGFARLNGEFAESLKLSKIGKTVTFKSSRTDLEFAKLDGDLDLDQGDLRAKDLAGPLRLVTRSKDINLEGVSGDARVENENGSIDFQLASAGNVQIDNRSGDIKVMVPDKVGFKVDARSRGGEVQTDFDKLKIENGDSSGTLSGTIGSGIARLVHNNEHGTIELRKSDEVPSPPDVPAMPHGVKPPKPPKAPAPLQPTDN